MAEQAGKRSSGKLFTLRNIHSSSQAFYKIFRIFQAFSSVMSLVLCFFIHLINVMITSTFGPLVSLSLIQNLTRSDFRRSIGSSDLYPVHLTRSVFRVFNLARSPLTRLLANDIPVCLVIISRLRRGVLALRPV